MNDFYKNFTPSEGYIKSPLADFFAPFMRTAHYNGWAGYLSAWVYDELVSEYSALRNQCGLIDICPMHKYIISGADAFDYCQKLVTRDLSKLAVGRVFYTVWCDQLGHIIDDGTIFRLQDNKFMISCQEPQYSWFMLNQGDFAVTIDDVSETLAAVALQGPTSYAVLKNAGYGMVADLKPFGIWQDENLMISRTGFTGDLGYELWFKPELGMDLCQKLQKAGQYLGFRPVGMGALDMARIEGGFLAINIDLMGAQHARRISRGRTPFEAGLDWLVSSDKKPYYNGKNALKYAQSTTRMRLVPVDIEFNKSAKGSLIYYKQKEWIGHITSAVWSPVLKRNIGFAQINQPYADGDFQHISCEIYQEKEGQYEVIWAGLSKTKRPFFNPARRTKTPPDLF